MRPDSLFLRDLNRDAGELRGVRFTSLWTPWDLMIFPPWSSVMAEARSIRVHVAAHPLMLRSERVMQLVEAALIDEGTDSAAGYGLTSSGSDRKPRSPEPVA